MSWGKPTVLMSRKASVLEAIWQAERTPPESESGACTQRGSLGTREDRYLLVREQPEQYGEPVYQRARREWAVPSLLASKNRMGASEVSGSERQSEATRDGEAVVLAEHSSEDRASGREGGEVRPKRPTEAKAKPGITFCRGER